MPRDPERVERIRERLAGRRLDRLAERVVAANAQTAEPAPSAFGDVDAGRGAGTALVFVGDYAGDRGPRRAFVATSPRQAAAFDRITEPIKETP
jgi:hypothetical protein